MQKLLVNRPPTILSLQWLIGSRGPTLDKMLYKILKSQIFWGQFPEFLIKILTLISWISFSVVSITIAYIRALTHN